MEKIQKLIKNPHILCYRLIDFIIWHWPIVTLPTKPLIGRIVLRETTKSWSKGNESRVADFYTSEHKRNLNETSRPFFDKTEQLYEQHRGIRVYTQIDITCYLTRYFQLFLQQGEFNSKSDLYFKSGYAPQGFLKFLPQTKLGGEEGFLVVGHGTSGYNYYHFLHEIFAQILLLIDTGDLRKGDQVFWMGGSSMYHDELKELLERRYGVDIHSIDLYKKYKFKRVVFTDRIVGHSFHYKKLLELVRKAIPDIRVGLDIDILIVGRRPHAQRYSPEIDEVLRITSDNFSVKILFMEDWSVAEQKAIWSGAKVIIAQHGAALANLCFCAKGTTIVELFQPQYTQICYASMADSMELQYFPLVIHECNKASNDLKQIIEDRINGIAPPPFPQLS